MVSGSALTASSRAGHTRGARIADGGEIRNHASRPGEGTNPCVPTRAVSNFVQTAPVNERIV